MNVMIAEDCIVLKVCVHVSWNQCWFYFPNDFLLFIYQGEITNSYYNGSSCICPNLTRYANQACGAFFLSIETINSFTQEINLFSV